MGSGSRPAAGAGTSARSTSTETSRTGTSISTERMPSWASISTPITWTSRSRTWSSPSPPRGDLLRYVRIR